MMRQPQNKKKMTNDLHQTYVAIFFWPDAPTSWRGKRRYPNPHRRYAPTTANPKRRHKSSSPRDFPRRGGQFAGTRDEDLRRQPQPMRRRTQLSQKIRRKRPKTYTKLTQPISCARCLCFRRREHLRETCTAYGNRQQRCGDAAQNPLFMGFLRLTASFLRALHPLAAACPSNRLDTKSPGNYVPSTLCGQPNRRPTTPGLMDTRAPAPLTPHDEQPFASSMARGRARGGTNPCNEAVLQ